MSAGAELGDRTGGLRLFDAEKIVDAELGSENVAVVHLDAAGQNVVEVAISRLVRRSERGDAALHAVNVHGAEARGYGERTARCAISTCPLAIHWLPAVARCAATTA